MRPSLFLSIVRRSMNASNESKKRELAMQAWLELKASPKSEVLNVIRKYVPEFRKLGP